jgi:Fic-DOC domain mobile mystery protein B
VTADPSGFVLRTIGPEPEGATPIEAEDLDGLIPDFVATRADLNLVEFENISKALPWALRQADSLGPISVLDSIFLFDLHRRMFSDVWKWAGGRRQRETNIGVAPASISVQVELALDDARYWHEHETFPVDERAARLHHRLVSIHPFPNGNGRCTRLLADLYLRACGEPPFTWGHATLDVSGSARLTYLAAIRAADDGDFAPLIDFARS